MAQGGVNSVRRGVYKRKAAGRPPACEAAARLVDLLDVATEVFLEYGYERASVSEIADRAGASKRTIYSRYPTKGDLFIAVIARKTQEVQNIFAKSLTSMGPLRAILQDFGTSLLEAMARPDLRALFDVVVAASPQFPELARAFWEIGPRQSTKMLRDCLAKHPDFKGKHPEDAAEMFCSMCWGLSILKRQLKKGYAIPKGKRQLRVSEAVRIFLAAYSELSD